MPKIIVLLCLAMLATLALDLAAQQAVSPTNTNKPIDYHPIFRWKHLDWKFRSAAMRAEYYRKEYFKTAMPAGVKVDAAGNFYMSVPRWQPGIPGTLNQIVVIDGKALLEPYPNWEMNKVGDPQALQSVLGYEIDENQIMWILDQGHVIGAPSIDGSQKLVKWDMKNNRLIESIKIDNRLASYQASFLNDLVVDNANGYIYITDSGIMSDPLQGGLLVYNMRSQKFRRVLHQHVSVQDEPKFWFKIAGVKVWQNKPMRTGADGIALSADRKTLYYCPLTSRKLYAVPTALLRDFTTSMSKISAAVKDLGSKGSNTDGMAGDNLGNVYYSMLEGQGVGVYNPKTGYKTLINDPRMLWVDGIAFDNHGNIIFNHNRLHQLFDGKMDWNNLDNLVIWKAYVGSNSYLVK